MEYRQKNPIPMPETGAYRSVKGTIDTVFDWQYALEDQKLLALYEKGKSLSWNVIEATHLLRDRLIAIPVFERLGWNTEVWGRWMMETPFQRGFRQMMFSKIVPNLKRLGLLPPRVREAFDKLDILRFEHELDSVQQPEVAPPQELVQMMMQYMQERMPTAE